VHVGGRGEDAVEVEEDRAELLEVRQVERGGIQEDSLEVVRWTERRRSFREL